MSNTICPICSQEAPSATDASYLNSDPGLVNAKLHYACMIIHSSSSIIRPRYRTLTNNDFTIRMRNRNQESKTGYIMPLFLNPLLSDLVESDALSLPPLPPLSLMRQNNTDYYKSILKNLDKQDKSMEKSKMNRKTESVEDKSTVKINSENKDINEQKEQENISNQSESKLTEEQENETKNQSNEQENEQSSTESMNVFDLIEKYRLQNKN